MSAFGLAVDPELICIFEGQVSKHEALDALVAALGKKKNAIRNIEEFRKALYAREEVMSTGIGQGIAIPHVRIDSVTEPVVAVGVAKEGIDFGTLDNEPVRIIVLFAMPAGSQRVYLGLLAQVMLTLKAPGFSEKLAESATPAEAAAILNK